MCYEGGVKEEERRGCTGHTRNYVATEPSHSREQRTICRAWPKGQISRFAVQKGGSGIGDGSRTLRRAQTSPDQTRPANFRKWCSRVMCT